MRPIKTQQGGFLGPLLASIGVPLLLNALTGKGTQVDSTGSPSNTVSVYVPDTTNGHGMITPYPYMSPPWNNPVGAGVKKKKKVKGITARQKQSIQFNANSTNNTLRFINKPLSNIDLLHWVTQLGIKYFRGIYSRKCKCKYLNIHFPQGFSGIIYNTGWVTLPDCLRYSLQVLKE